MNKKTAGVILMCFLAYILTGCDSKTFTRQVDVSNYKYDNINSRFKVVSVENICDGTNNGITISTLIDKETKVMYVQTEKFQSGYGLALQVIVDQDGKPLIYKNNLE